jgi:hypothetical protein
MKTTLIILFLSLATLCKAQEDKYAEYKAYKPCSECFETWHTAKYSSQSHTLQTNNMARQSSSYGRTQLRNVVGVICVAIVGVITYAVLTKSNSIANATH